MVLRSLLLLTLTCLTFDDAESVTCTFKHSNISRWGYGCELINQSIESESDLATIDGDHITDMSDEHVLWIKSTNSRISFFPNRLVAHFPNLTRATFHKSQMTSLGRAISCDKLIYIGLDDNFLFDIPETTFTNCNQLKTLDLNRNNLGNIAEHAFSALTRIKSLGLGESSITSIHPNAFSSLVRLREIDLNSNEIEVLDSNLFEHLERLNSVRIDNNRLASFSLNFYFSKQMVINLNIQNNLLTHFGTSLLSPCFYADLSNNLIEEIPFFENTFYLRKLNLDNNKIKKTLPGTFRDFCILTYLRISHNQIVDLQPGTFSGLHHLRELYLNSNNITDLQPNTFIGLTNLGYLYLTDNQLTRLTASSFAKLYSLLELHVERNQIGRIDRELFDVLPKLNDLDLTGNVCANESVSSNRFSSRSSTIFPILKTCGITSSSVNVHINAVLFVVILIFSLNKI